MGESWIALAVAVVGVVGTLGAALLTQSRADRSKRMELQALTEQQREERRHSEELRKAERAEAHARELLDLRRSCYITLNTASRQYQTAQVNLLYALRNQDGVDSCLEQLEARRVTHRDSYAEAQMIVPEPVFDTAGEASRSLNRGYGTLKRLAAASPTEQELEAFTDFIDASWGLLSAMRRQMRRDLAIDNDGATLAM
ncbi:hypothetical protein [Streptomyces sp. NPDC056227]|uniref:hypothetical protein n=1 Tax=Streptomyces sp. NPDC056227 TaxID=3345753 RepID=UPI0035DFEBCA